jgi:hypothetical protein
VEAGDSDILVACDAGYDLARLANLLADLLVEVLGWLRSDPIPAAAHTRTSARHEHLPRMHGGEFNLLDTGRRLDQAETARTGHRRSMVGGRSPLRPANPASPAASLSASPPMGTLNTGGPAQLRPRPPRARKLGAFV